MLLHYDIVSARFISRPNRFLVLAELDNSGELVRAHCPDSGRLSQLLVPNAQLYLTRADRTERLTAYDLRFAVHAASGQLVSVDSRMPNALFAEAVTQNVLPAFAGYHDFQREVVVPISGMQPTGTRSRIDFLLSALGCPRFWVEVKSVTLVENRTALFPDAPTSRGVRHIRELAGLMRKHVSRAAVVFVVQRPDAEILRPYRKVDPDFADALASAAGEGLQLFGYTCTVSLEEIRIDKTIPVALSKVD